MSNVNDTIRALEGVAVQTSKGTYVPLTEVKKLLEQRAEEKEAAARDDRPPPGSFQEATRRAKQDEEFVKGFPKPTPGLGRAVVANQPPSAVEGVKA